MTASQSTSNHPVGEVRHGQLITTYGPGAMVDLPDRSVVVGGLNLWHYSRDDDSCFIDEPRLIAKLRGLLGVGTLLLKRPPSEDDTFAQKFKSSSGIRSPQFPLWFVAQPKDPFPPHIDEAGRRYRTRPLIHKDRLVDEKYPWRVPGGKVQKLDVVPVRFVQCCANGHLSDIDWDRFAHGGARSRCQEDLWLDEAGAGNDFNEIYVRCPQCGKRQALASTKGESGASLLGACRGHRPWLGNFSDEALDCTDEKGKPRYNRLLVRSASNAYFPEMVGAISIPEAEDPLSQLIVTHLSDFEKISSAEKLSLLLELDALKERIAAPLRGRDPHDVMAILHAVRGSGKDARTEKQPALKLQEIKALYAPPGFLGSADPAASFHAEIVSLNGKPAWFTERFDRVLKVHRLREVMALIGFTRLEPIVKGVDGDPVDQHAVGATRAAINNKELDWVPAIENFGEGLFLGVNQGVLQAWQQREGVVQHSSKHREACKLWNRDHGLKANEFDWPGEAYLMLHSLAHLLITTAALECGYGASAIKERIYSFPGHGYGILLYTSGSGSEGTLGGLVSLADSIEQLVATALDRGQLCSNDPFCSMHQPESDLEKRYSHGAACHGCLLIAETSCEQRNQFLDRAFVVPTLDVTGAAFFPQRLP
ncbi:DUF1998 domain-containing protein [Aphanothece minutissima]|uniref:MrfA-like Zn-binding domain-containing protein n=1 Tax=Aphanothece cf. minutissima CCALA 015 TaxID=2107695 RepID=A0ABX5FC63_9CHRO|nr:DUF1998 domain-containing protein [Aphanothece minutissima]PSB38498.1 hypothetical protein C7B81_02655 [Aphanothece cf. minutissima CCALA 015]